MVLKDKAFLIVMTILQTYKLETLQFLKFCFRQFLLAFGHQVCNKHRWWHVRRQNKGSLTSGASKKF